MRARTRARTRPTRARAQISSPKVDLVSLFAIWRAYLRARTAYSRCARVGRARMFVRARLGLARAPRARARLYLLARLARAPVVARAPRARVKCSRARAAHPAAGEAPYMNSYVLNQAKLLSLLLYMSSTLAAGLLHDGSKVHSFHTDPWPAPYLDRMQMGLLLVVLYIYSPAL